MSLPSCKLVALAAAAASLLACQRPSVRTAPFRVRPDSVRAGDLRGPFSGQVIDAATGEPVAGAFVYGTWTFENGLALSEPAGTREFVTSTDARGRYRIPAVKDVPRQASKRRYTEIPRGARLVAFRMVIYKRGFVAYRSDRRFLDLGPRHDFAQLNNEIRLERWRREYSHARHLRYVGGGPALATLTSWEEAEAADELSERSGAGPAISSALIPRRGSNVVAGKLISVAEIKAITRYDGGFVTGPLGDDPDTAEYSSQHFQAQGRNENFDLAVRLWKLDPGSAQKRYEALVDSLPKVQETNEIANRSLRALEGSIHGVAFLDGQRGVVVLLTCGQSQCADADTAARLGKKMNENLQRLWPLRRGSQEGPK